MGASLRKKLLFAALPAVLAVAAAAAVLEAVLRYRYERIAQITGVTDWKDFTFGNLTYHWDCYHPVYGWTNLPGYRSDDRAPFRVTINARGLRADREYSPQPPSGIRRLALFGDSCTFGEEVNDDETIAAHLERALRDTEVLNFGVHGYGLGQMALRLEHEGFGFHPDHVVVIYLTYDFLREPLEVFCHNKPVFTMGDGRLRITNVPVPEASRQPWLIRYSYAAAWLWGREGATKPRSPATLDAGLEIVGAILDRIRRRCAAREIPLTVVHISDGPTLTQMRAAPAERARVHRVSETLRYSGVDPLDLVSFLEDKFAERGAELLAPQGHWSGTGNAIIARQIARRLCDGDGNWVCADQSDD